MRDRDSQFRGCLQRGGAGRVTAQSRVRGNQAINLRPTASRNPTRHTPPPVAPAASAAHTDSSIRRSGVRMSATWNPTGAAATAGVEDPEKRRTQLTNGSAHLPILANADYRPPPAVFSRTDISLWDAPASRRVETTQRNYEPVRFFFIF